MSHYFTATLWQFPTLAGTWHFIDVPLDIAAVFGKRAHVRVMGELNGVEFATTLLPRANGEPHFMAVNRALRKRARLTAGDTVSVRMEEDFRPREIVVPEDLEMLLEEEPEAKAIFDRFPKAKRKYIVDWIEGAKKMETRITRLSKTVELIWKMQRRNG